MKPKIAPICVSPRTAAETLGISHTSMRALLRRGEILHRRMGKRILVPVAALHAYAGVQQTGGAQ
jgi:excisionase family DNA binding protein